MINENSIGDITAFKQLINSKAIIPTEPDGDKVAVTLDESTENGSCIVTIKNIPKASLIFKLDDNFSAPDKIFNNNRSEACRADYILIVRDKDTNHLIFIEIKKSKDKRKNILSQLNGAASFIFYCYGILKFFWKESNFQPNNYKFHYIAFKHIHNYKYNQGIDNIDLTSDFLTIRGKYATYNHLLAHEFKP